MLTRKQVWRRFKSKSPQLCDYRSIRSSDISYNKSEALPSDYDETSTVCESSDSSNPCISNTSSLNSISVKRVHFSPKVRVCLVPRRSELSPIFDLLYWSQNDYCTFKHEAIMEIKEHMISNKSPNGQIISMKEAQTSLYQPELSTENTNSIPSISFSALKTDSLDCNDDFHSPDSLKILHSSTTSKQKFHTQNDEKRETMHLINLSKSSNNVNVHFQTNDNSSEEKKTYYKIFEEYSESEMVFESEVDNLFSTQSLTKCLNTIRRKDSVQLFKVYQSSDELVNEIDYNYTGSAIFIS